MNRFLERIADLNPDAVKADGFDDCIIGITEQSPVVLVYSSKKCIRKLMRRDALTRDDAEEHFSFNIAAAYVGKGTPIFVDTR